MKFDLQFGLRKLKVERTEEGWRVWVHLNTAENEGTFLLLKNNGSIHRGVLRRDGTEDLFVYEGTSDEV